MKRMHPRAMEIEAYVWSTLASPTGVQAHGRPLRLVRRVWTSILEALRIHKRTHIGTKRHSNGFSRIP